MKRSFRAGAALCLLAFVVLASTVSAAPYRRTEELKYTRTSTSGTPVYAGYVAFTGAPTVATYRSDSLIRNSASGQRLDTLYFSIRDLAMVRSTSGALVDSMPLFTVFMEPDLASGITLSADSAYAQLSASEGHGGYGISGSWVGGTNIILLEVATDKNTFAKSYSFNGLWGSPPTTVTDVTLGLYDTYRLIMQSDANGSYRYYVSYIAESTAPHQPLQP